MKKFIAIIAIVVIAAIAIIPRVTSSNNSETDTTTTSAVTVSVAEAKQGDLALYVDLIGDTSASTSVSVTPTALGKVLTIDAKVGDFVHEGDVLFTMDKEDVQKQYNQAAQSYNQAGAAVSQANVGIEQAKLGVEQATLAYEMAKNSYDMNVDAYNFAVENLEKYKILYDQGVISEVEYKQMELQAAPETLSLYEQQLQQAEQALGNAQLGLDQAGAAYTQAGASYNMAGDSLDTVQDTLDDMVVVAPISGYVTSLNVSLEETPSMGMPVAVVQDLDRIKVTTDITPTLANNLEIGQEVMVSFSDIDGTYSGMIDSIGTSAGSNLLYPMEVVIENTEHIIKPGMFASVSAAKEDAKGVVVVPTEAVVLRGGENVVFIKDTEDSVKMSPVITGVDDGYYVEIKSGVNLGDMVVTTGVGFVNETTLVSFTTDETNGGDE